MVNGAECAFDWDGRYALLGAVDGLKSGGCMQENHIHPDRRRQLFLDDGAIESMSELRRSLHQPARCGPVVRPNRSRGEMHVQSGSAPQWNPDRGLWEWWYSGYTSLTEDSLSLYATSADGFDWEMPDLGLYEWNGDKSNNVVYDSPERNLAHVIRDESDADPGRRYKALFSDAAHLNRHPGFSPDGFQWTFPDVKPIPSQDTSQMVHDKSSHRYLATVKHRTQWGRSAWLVTSADFLAWTDPELVMHTDAIDQENRRRRIQAVVDDPAYLSPPVIDGRDYMAELYELPIMPYEGLYIGFPLVFSPAGTDPDQANHTGLNQVELAVSSDARHWERVADRALFIAVEPWEGGANFGNAQVALCGPPCVRDQEIWIYYLAYRLRGHRDLFAKLDPTIYNDDFFNECSAICLAKLRRDGFVSLDASAGGGELLTRPFGWTGGDLCVNVDAAEGEMLAEVVDAESLRPLRGWSALECQPLRGDLLGEAVRWEGAERTSTEGRSVRLRFCLRRASLYSFWLG